MFAECWFLALLPVVMTLMYSLVYIEPRYLAGFFVLFWVSILIAAAKESSTRLRQARPILYALLFVLVVGFAQRTGRQVISAFMSHPMKQVELANAMASMGLPAHSKIGVLGNAFDLLSVRAARYSIVAAIPDSQERYYLDADERETERVDHAFQSAGAQALLMHSCFPPSQPGWKNVRDSDLYLKFLSAPPDTRSR